MKSAKLWKADCHNNFGKTKGSHFSLFLPSSPEYLPTGLLHASAVNIGQNLLAEWHNSDKKNQGYGQNFDDHSDFYGSKSFVDDRDQIDTPTTFVTTPIQDRSVQVPK